MRSRVLIVALTAFAREYVRTRVLHAPASGGVGEVGQLSSAFVRMVRDIDLSQKKLIRASKLAVVGEMSSVIAHEVRTPLGIMRSSAQVLGREPGISAEGRELAGFIESETERLNRSRIRDAGFGAASYADLYEYRHA